MLLGKLTKNKLLDWICGTGFYIFIFSIPFQIRKVLFSFLAADKFVEWNSGFLYFTDLLLIGIFILWIRRLILTKSDFIKKSDFWLIGFFLIAGLSLIVSQNITISVYQLIKLAELILLFLYVKYNLEFLKIKNILKIFVASGVFQSLIAIGQFFSQSSLGLKYFEAGVFNANIPGVATFFVNGVKFIRAYGTFPHPNVLAVFLLFAIFCIYALWLRDIKISKSNYKLLATSYTVLALGLFLTFSRAVILVFIAVSLLFFLISFFKFKELRRKIAILFLLFVICHLLFVICLWPEVSARFLNISMKEQAVTLRVYYNDIALSAIKEKPILGLGAGNFVWYLFNNYQFKELWLYQPVHNLYLLIASEVGIFGLLIFLIFIGFNIWKSNFLRKLDFVKLIFLSLFAGFLLLSLIDHYFWTIQQSRFIFWIGLAIISSLAHRNATNKA